RDQPLATLGDSLVLGRRRVCAAGSAGARFDVGEYESDAICLVETDQLGLCLRQEVFAVDRLGDAIARLYERFAELLADGPGRERAAATARSVAAFFGPTDFDRYATAIGPDVVLVHHRGLVGQRSSRGRDAWLRVFRVIFATADETSSAEDILAL